MILSPFTFIIFNIFFFFFLCIYPRFIIGDPDPSIKTSASFPLNQVKEALLLERHQYGDVLIGDELYHLVDRYDNLVNKTKSFMKYAIYANDDGNDNDIRTSMHGSTASHNIINSEKESWSHTWKWLMMLDDDVYLKVKDLLIALQTSAPHNKFYSGQVWSHTQGTPIKPQRQEKHRNYLSESDYPMSELPPFAIGPHYMLSR